MHHLLLAAISWDPQIRGALIVITAFLILPGSVYLLLATNTGAKIGFVLAITGLTGWIAVMAVIWMVYGIGLKGREKHWAVKEVVAGSIADSSVQSTTDFPKQWKLLPPGDATRADAQAAADAALVPAPVTAGAHEGGGGSGQVNEPPRFTSPFKQTTDYVTIDAYHRGGDNQLFTIGRHKFYFRHSAHYAVVQVKPALDQSGGPGGAPPVPVPDLAAPTYSVIMVRDLGSLRFPPFVVALSSFTIFAICCYWLHQRDKQIWAAKAAEPAVA